MRDYLFFYINGKPYQLTGESIFQSLSNFLRYELLYTGTKLVCEEGDCGACTVLLGRLSSGEITYKTVNSCITYLYQLDCCHIITIEGLKYSDNKLNPVQEAMVNHHGSQCGFCTPGFVMSIYDLCQKQPSVTTDSLKCATAGNLCRCTGYESIIQSGQNVSVANLMPISKLYPSEDITQSLGGYKNQSVKIMSGDRVFFQPATLKEACDFKWEFPDSTIIAGGTDIGVLQNKRDFKPNYILSLSKIQHLHAIAIQDNILTVGASITLSELEEFIETHIPEWYSNLEFFGSPQIKNFGTLVGNIANGSPIGDSLPLLMVTNAWIDIACAIRVRTLPIKELYTGYKTLELKSKEIISRVSIPIPAEKQILRLYKVSRRKHMDIATFTAAFLMQKKEDCIEWINIAYGGVGPIVMRLTETEAFLKGKPYVEETFIEAAKIAQSEITPISDVRGDKLFRMQLAENILLKFYHENMSNKVPV